LIELIELVLAAACFATGGLFMKKAAGVSRLVPTAIFLILFLAGAAFQSLGMRRFDLGVAYIAVLGLEAALALLLSVFILHEGYSVSKIVAISLILAGVTLLRRS
jgi:multidrug transporter EmrE-like cation transporter